MLQRDASAAWVLVDQDYYHVEFTLGEAGPPGYVVLTDLDYYKAFSNKDERRAITQISTGLAQLQG